MEIRSQLPLSALSSESISCRAVNDLRTRAMLLHNHPSGDPSPSRADIDITRAVAEAGKRLGIALHDHIIIGTAGHTSLRAQGLI